MTADNVKDFFLLFTSIFWEAFPFVVLGALVAGVLEELVPQQAITKVIPQNRYVAVALGGFLGLIFPMCECGIVPVMRRLLRKGLPLGTCLAYMLSGPIINVVVITSTAVAFGPHGVGWQMVLLRVGIGFVIAVTTGLLVELILLPRHGADGLLTDLAKPQPGQQVHPAEGHETAGRPLRQRLANITETTLHDFVDILVYLTLGALLAGFVKLMITQETIAEVSTGMPAVAILSMMGLAVLLCLCSEADAFVAASFSSLHNSAKLGFLVLGPMIDIKLLFMFTRVFRTRLILFITTAVVLQVFVYTMAAHYVWEAAGWKTSNVWEKQRAAESVSN